MDVSFPGGPGVRTHRVLPARCHTAPRTSVATVGSGCDRGQPSAFDMVEHGVLGCGRDARNHPVDRTCRRDAAPARQRGAAARPRRDRRPAGPAAPDRPRHPAHAARGRVRRPGPRHRALHPRRGPAPARQRVGPPRPALPGDELGRLAGRELGAGGAARHAGRCRRRARAPRLPARRLTATAADGGAAPAARHGRGQVPARLRADRRAPAARARPAALHRTHHGRRRHVDRAPRRGPAPGLGGGAGGAPDGRRRDRRAAPDRRGAGGGRSGRRGPGGGAVQRRRDTAPAGGRAAAQRRPGDLDGAGGDR